MKTLEKRFKKITKKYVVFDVDCPLVEELLKAVEEYLGEKYNNEMPKINRRYYDPREWVGTSDKGFTIDDELTDFHIAILSNLREK